MGDRASCRNDSTCRERRGCESYGAVGTGWSGVRVMYVEDARERKARGAEVCATGGKGVAFEC